jgi:MoxR-like ATPase
LGLAHTAQALALVAGRDFVLPDDVKALAVPVLAHRLLLAPSARLRGGTVREIIEDVVNSTPVPA